MGENVTIASFECGKLMWMTVSLGLDLDVGLGHSLWFQLGKQN